MGVFEIPVSGKSGYKKLINLRMYINFVVLSCNYLILSIVRKDDDTQVSNVSYNTYAYCDGDAHESGNFDFKPDRTKILNEFRYLLPYIMRSSIWRGSDQKVEFEDISQEPLDDLITLENMIYSSLDPVIKERITNSTNIHLFTDDTLVPWELMCDEESFVCLNHPFGMSPITTKRISKRLRNRSGQLGVMPNFFENNPKDLSWSAFKLYGNPLKK